MTENSEGANVTLNRRDDTVEKAGKILGTDSCFKCEKASTSILLNQGIVFRSVL